MNKIFDIIKNIYNSYQFNKLKHKVYKQYVNELQNTQYYNEITPVGDLFFRINKYPNILCGVFINSIFKTSKNSPLKGLKLVLEGYTNSDKLSKLPDYLKNLMPEIEHYLNIQCINAEITNAVDDQIQIKLIVNFQMLEYDNNISDVAIGLSKVLTKYFNNYIINY